MSSRKLSPYEMTQLARHGGKFTPIIGEIPVEYITGIAEFCGLEFMVSPDVLIPRIETEGLVELALQAVAEKLPTTTSRPLKILDVGTGSGAIIISLAKHLESMDEPFSLSACDISPQALQIATMNAQELGVAGIEFIESDLLSRISQPQDVIIANLPYIPSDTLPTLDLSVTEHEPLLALDGGSDGFEIIRKLLSHIETHLTPQGTILLEVDQMHDSIFFASYNMLYEISYFQDCFHRHRFVRLDLKN